MQRLLLTLIIGIALLRVAATYRVLCQTVDEGVHIAAGYEWLTSRGYTINPEHPPLARIAFGLWPRVTAGKPAPGVAPTGNDLLFLGGHYERNLAGSRAPNLIFFGIAMVVLYLWSRSLVAVALFSLLPPVLAHAGFATTDMIAAAAVVTALYALTLWLDAPSRGRMLFLGIAIGAGLSAKFSFLPFFLPAALVLLIARSRRVAQASSLRPRNHDDGRRLEACATRERVRWKHLPAIAVLALTVVWVTYKFDIGTLLDARLRALPPSPNLIAAQYARSPGYEWVRADILERYYEWAKVPARRPVDIVDWLKAAGYPSPLAGRRGEDTMSGERPIPPLSFADRVREPFRAAWQWIAVHVPLPAPMWFAGAEVIALHNEVGHPTYFLGQYGSTGWWYYFPVILFFKTPVAFLVLWAIGFVVLLRTPGHRALALLPLVMLIPPMFSAINIGIRHILPVYAPMAMAAAAGVDALWRARTAYRTLAVVLLGWMIVRGALAHPDYVADFNEFAGAHPEQIASDSNLDWGQDVLRLSRYERAHNLQPFYFNVFGSVDPRRFGSGGTELQPGVRVHGWVAISEMLIRTGPPDDRGGGFRWLEQFQPERRIGKSIRLYRVP